MDVFHGEWMCYSMLNEGPNRTPGFAASVVMVNGTPPLRVGFNQKFFVTFHDSDKMS